MAGEMIISEGLEDLNINKEHQAAIKQSLDNANVKLVTFKPNLGLFNFNPKYLDKITAFFDMSNEESVEFLKEVKKMPSNCLKYWLGKN